MDGYACHVDFKTLLLLRDNGIVVAGLPAHASSVLKPLDLSIFGPLKEQFRLRLNIRTMTTAKNGLQYVFTIFEVLRNAYQCKIQSQVFDVH